MWERVAWATSVWLLAITPSSGLGGADFGIDVNQSSYAWCFSFNYGDHDAMEAKWRVVSPLLKHKSIIYNTDYSRLNEPTTRDNVVHLFSRYAQRLIGRYLQGFAFRQDRGPKSISSGRACLLNKLFLDQAKAGVAFAAQENQSSVGSYPNGRGLSAIFWNNSDLEPREIFCYFQWAYKQVFQRYPRSFGSDENIATKLVSRHSGRNGPFHIAGLSYTATPSNNPKADGRYSQHPGKANEPRRKECDGIASCLFPKPVLLIFLSGALLGCLIIGWAVIDWEGDKKPKRKRDQY